MTAYVAILETTTLSLGASPVDFTDQVKKVVLTVQVEKKDVTTFAALGAKVLAGGMESGSLKVDFVNDYTDNKLDELMWAAMKGRVPIAFSTQVAAGTVSATNPKFTGSVLVSSWVPINGGPGDVAEVSCDLETSGPTTRNVT